MAEREEIRRGVAAGEPCRQIAARLGASTLDGVTGAGQKRRPWLLAGQAADAAAFRRTQRPKPAKLGLGATAGAVVEAKLGLR